MKILFNPASSVDMDRLEVEVQKVLREFVASSPVYTVKEADRGNFAGSSAKLSNSSLRGVPDIDEAETSE